MESGFQENEMKTNVRQMDNFYIAGIGASAGGLEAITELFDNVNPDIACAFVIIQHLSPDYKSLMPELLASHTRLPIVVAEDDMYVKRGTIYLIPHKKTMTISYGKLRLKDKEKLQSPQMTIDIFFKSLAEYKNDKAIGIILSGTGTDGTKGLQCVKDKGGFCIVQDPLSAKFDGMPNSAINAGIADIVLAPELIPEEIINYIEQTPREKSTLQQFADNDEQNLVQIINLVKDKTGNDFSSYKRPTIIRRISRRMGFKNLNDLYDYTQYLKENQEEIVALSKEFLIGVTKFFRDAAAFDFLAKKIIPDIINGKEEKEVVKVWVAGCSTGEEAYSIAILIYDYLKYIGRELEVKIFATDIDKDAIDKASKGTFTEKDLKDIPEDKLTNYFERIGTDYTVIPIVRKMIIFAQHDLIKDAPFSKMDLVSCRNLLIYFGPELQKKAFSKFHFSLNIGGYMFLGSSENIGNYSVVFSEINKKWKIYKSTKEFNPNFSSFPFPRVNLKVDSIKPKPQPAVVDTTNFSELFVNGLIEIAGYAAIFVNEDAEILHAIGNFRQYLNLPEKTLDFHLLKMVPEDLSVILGSTLRKCFKTNESVSMNGCRVSDGDKKKIINVVIQPVLDKKKNKMAIVYLNEASKEYSMAEPSVDNKNITDPQTLQMTLLQQELSETKENLQSLVEELETANEEMQSSNEELTSANEELQSTNEELQSLNEELHTVNFEHQLKIKELIELNDDLNNYFSSTDIGQVFVDNNLLIRKFTPAVKWQINLIDNDIGRPISHISNNIKYDDLLNDLRRVVKNGEIVEKEIQLSNEKWYLMKILPYIRHDKTIDGAILAFIDITRSKELSDHVFGILNSSLNGIMAYMAVRNDRDEIIDFKCTLTNPSMAAIFKKPAAEIADATLLQILPAAKENKLFEKLVNVVNSGNPLHIEQEFNYNGSTLWLKIAAVRINSGIAVTLADITEEKFSEDKMRNAFIELRNTKDNLQNLNNELERRVLERTKELSISEERFRLLSLATNDAIWDWNFLTNQVWWNEGFVNLFGYKKEETLPGINFLFEKIHPEDKERVVNGIQEIISSGKKIWTSEYRLLKSDGSYAFVLDRAYVLQYDQEKVPYRMIGSMIDLSNLKKAQMQLEQTNQNLMKINTDLDNFIYTASHDLKAPISNIEGLMYTLDDILLEYNIAENGPVRDILAMVNLSINRFKETIHDLTEIAKIQKENMEDQENVNIIDLVEEIKFSIKDMFNKSKAEIEYHLQEPTVIFSRRNIRSIMYNLVSNAIKYRSPDRNPVIKIYSYKENDYTVVNIQDNGLGIPEDKQSKVFGMFKRMHNHVDGTGIGLYIVKRAIENAGGKIVLESEEGKGSNFKLYFHNNPLS